MSACNEEPCAGAARAFLKARTEFRAKKAAHLTECAELKAASGRLVAFLNGIAVTLGAYIGTAITIALQSLAAGSGVAAALTAISGSLAGLASTLSSIPFIGQALAVVAVAAIATLGVLAGLYAKNVYDENQTRQACDVAFAAANAAHGAALNVCPVGGKCVPDFTETCNCP